MALTLAEAAKAVANQGDDFRAAVIEIYANAHPILQVLPFETIQGNALRYNQESTLPGIGFRGVNEGYTESTGVINPQVEPLVIAGGDLDVDRFNIQTMGEGARSSQESMKAKALAHRWAQKFIKGDSDTDPKEFDGLQKRLAGAQLIANGASANGDPLKLTQLDALLDAVDTPQYLLMTKAMKRRLTQASRSTSVGGHVEFTTDSFGRSIMSYDGIPVLTVDNNDVAYAPLAFDEANPGGGTNTGTSIYAVDFGTTKLSGIQSELMSVRDLGEQDSKPVFRTRVEWYAGIAMQHPRAAARLWGISDAPVTAS